MEAVARARFVRMSARKVRRVAELVRGKNVNEAIEILNFVPKAAAVPLQKTIKSAASNVLSEEGTAKIHPEDLRIKTLFIDGGPIWKRFRAVGMGRAYRIRKRTCHITVVVEGEPKAEALKSAAAKTKAAPAKEEPKKTTKVKAAAEKPAVEEKKKVEKKTQKATKKARE
ncbi:MAG: 50S ribosomal protein L22 [candidate division Zixibacteria bacterium]|nr:50S ribosomal protein L22 [candidate division Zixibacteria bacterium]MCI0596947.1 50S ribosomal protein L22 [candidate division Zixibacteria bacterium]